MVRHETSLRRRLMTLLLTITIPLAALLIAGNLYSVNLFNDKIAESNRRTLDFSVDLLESELEAVDQTLSGLIAGSADFITLSSGTGQLQAHLSSLALLDRVKSLSPAHPSVGAFFVYSKPSAAERDTFLKEYSFEEKRSIRAFVREAVAEDQITYAMRWRSVEIGGQYYLFRFFGGRGTYIAAMFPLDTYLNQHEWQIDGTAVPLFSDQMNQPLTQRAWIEENEIRLDGDQSNYFITGDRQRYLSVGRDIANTDARLIFLISDVGFFAFLNMTQITMLILSFSVVILLPLLIYWANRLIILPIANLTGTMTRIRRGDLEAQVSTEGQVREFREMGETFNQMMTEIKSLRIESYEHEIDTQKAQLRYLQLQIRPHFFLNCLKSIYAFAQQKEYDKLQKMILSFSRHIRYIFKDNFDFVPLGLELDHVRNYIDIQAISAVHPPILRIRAEESLLKLPIPPLLVQTFVENAVKHETDPDKSLEIDVDVQLLRTETSRYVNIIVSDNGHGFPTEVLEEINLPSDSVYEEHHVGLNNVKQRLQLIYEGDVQFAFYNNNGSVSDIIIPIDEANVSMKGGRS